MNNPLQFFHTILFNSHDLYKVKFSQGEDELITFKDDIGKQKILEEARKVFLIIDDQYWKGNSAENYDFLSRLLNILRSQIKAAENQLEKHLNRVVSYDLNKWMVPYYNMQCVYENLISIRTYVLNYYCDHRFEKEKHSEMLMKYPELNNFVALELSEICSENAGKCDTNYVVNTFDGEFTITVKTKNMHPLDIDIRRFKTIVYNPEKDNISEIKAEEREYPHVFEWKGTPKEFVQSIIKLVDSKKLTINGVSDRTPIVNALYQLVGISTLDKKTGEKKQISHVTLQTYFKKEANGEVY